MIFNSNVFYVLSFFHSKTLLFMAGRDIFMLINQLS